MTIQQLPRYQIGLPDSSAALNSFCCSGSMAACGMVSIGPPMNQMVPVFSPREDSNAWGLHSELEVTTSGTRAGPQRLQCDHNRAAIFDAPCCNDPNRPYPESRDVRRAASAVRASSALRIWPAGDRHSGTVGAPPPPNRGQRRRDPPRGRIRRRPPAVGPHGPRSPRGSRFG